MSRVVLVDDHAEDLELYAHVLRHGGHEVTAFQSSIEALGAIAAAPPDLVVADLLMPELDGFELVHALRTDPRTHAQPVVLASAVYVDSELDQLVAELEPCRFLPKPVTPEALLAAVAAALASGAAPGVPSDDFQRRHHRTLHRKLLAEARRWERAERELTQRAADDAALAELSRRALGGLSGRALVDATRELVRDRLGADVVELIEVSRPRLAAADAPGGEPAGAPGRYRVTQLAESELPARLVERGLTAGIRTSVPSTGTSRLTLSAYWRSPLPIRDRERALLEAASHIFGEVCAAAESHALIAERERELEGIFEGARDALLVLDHDLRCLRANRAAALLFGRAQGELPGLHAAEVLTPEALDAFRHTFGEIGDGATSGRATVVRPGGAERVVSYAATPEILPGRHLIAFRDVTRRVEMEQALRQASADAHAAERRYHELIESLPDGILAVDESGLIVLVNARIEQMFGYRRDELLGQRLELLLPARHRSAHERHRGAFTAAAGSRPMGPDLDLHGLRKDGSEFPVEVTLSTVQTAEGRLVTSVVTDVSERKALERQYQQAQKLEAVGRLAGGVAHDFNNVLQVIGGRTEILAEGRAHEPDLAEGLAEIAAAAGRATALTRQLLAFSRRQTLQPVVLDVNEVVEDMHRLLARMIGADVTIALELDPGLPSVRADRAQLEQVLANLAVNARDAMPDGGTLTVSTSTVALDGGASALELAPGSYVRLRVADTGTGMDEETVARAFEPFFTTKEESRGSGLGLATVHGIVTQSRGAVRIETAPGAGTAISVFLPLVEAAEQVVDQPAPASPVAGGHERVLLVEDEEPIRRLLALLVSSLGYEVTPAEDGAAALAAVDEAAEPFDLVITDFVMPRLSGPALVAALAEHGATPPVLYISGYAPGGPGLEGALDDARSAFLQKPFPREELARTMRSLIDRAGMPA